jgi:hypothetical protein
MNIDWKLQIGSAYKKAQGVDQEYPITDMSEIYSFVQPDKTNKIYACGYRWHDTPQKKARSASMFKMDDQGEIQYMYLFGLQGVKSPIASVKYVMPVCYQDPSKSEPDHCHDICRAINYDTENREVVMMLEVTSPALRPDLYLYKDYSAANRDILIMTMKDDGRLL